MLDKEKVIRGLEYCDIGGCGTCYEKECPYYQSHDCTDELKNDILTLLKEQDSCENCAIAIEDRPLVIRCKECKYHYNEIRCRCGGFTSDDWFCPGGKRRTDDA